MENNKVESRIKQVVGSLTHGRAKVITQQHTNTYGTRFCNVYPTTTMRIRMQQRIKNIQISPIS